MNVNFFLHKKLHFTLENPSFYFYHLYKQYDKADLGSNVIQ